MRKIKIRKDTPLGTTPEVKDTTNYSKKEKKANSVRFNPPTLDEYYSVEHKGGKLPSIGF